MKLLNLYIIKWLATITENKAWKLFKSQLQAVSPSRLSKAKFSHNSKKHLHQAHTLFSRVAKQDTENWTIFWALGRINEALGKDFKALGLYTKTYKINPHCLQIEKDAGRVALKFGLGEIYQITLIIHNLDADLHITLCLDYLINGELEKAQVSAEIVKSTCQPPPNFPCYKHLFSMCSVVRLCEQKHL